jgi:hypothetical protein
LRHGVTDDQFILLSRINHVVPAVTINMLGMGLALYLILRYLSTVFAVSDFRPKVVSSRKGFPLRALNEQSILLRLPALENLRNVSKVGSIKISANPYSQTSVKKSVLVSTG